MSSSIDPSNPTEGTATTASVRDNFSAAKSEIETLQTDVIAAQTDATNALANAATAAAAAAAAQATADAVASSVMHTIYPIGSLYTSTLATNPNTLLGFGTWSAFGVGRVMVSQDTGYAPFDTLEETGGELTHTLTSSEMPSHNHTQNSHNHTQDAHTHTQDSHNHTQNAHTHIQDPHHHIPQRWTVGAGGSWPSATSAAASTASSAGAPNTTDTTATNQNTTATNQATTATNQNTTATNQATTATNNLTGGGDPHNNVQPYIIVKVWKRTA
jgi:microcystin-dependent protein